MGGQDPIEPVDEVVSDRNVMDLDGVGEDLVEMDDLVDGFPQFNGLGEDDLVDIALIKALFSKKNNCNASSIITREGTGRSTHSSLPPPMSSWQDFG